MAIYNNDTWSNWTKWDDRNPNERYAEDNALFSTSYKSRPEGAPKILRGYMRSANPAQFGQSRLFFQYNPTTLQRTSTAQSNVYLTQLQNPADVQGAGSAGFAFSLLFDRQAEVASNQSDDPRLTRTINGVTVTDASGVLRPNAGVQGDIAVFDAITGIGQITRAAQTATANSVQFVSYPVRVIFSPSIMVEGLVDSAIVTLNKFNHEMVPTVCTIQVTMTIRYLGAAVKDTGITWAVGPEQQGMENPQFWPNASGLSSSTGTEIPSTRGDTTVAKPPTGGNGGHYFL